MKTLAGLVILAATALGQEYYRHNFHINMGAGLPRGELRPLFETSFMAGFGYGYRFHEFLQADVGLDTLFGAAGIRDFLPTYVGNVRIKDYQYFLPFGGRAILPFASDRVLVYGGGGGTYMRYTERIRQPYADSGFRIDCDVCSSRHGIGYYGLVGVDIALDRAQHFRIGAGGRVIRGETDGDPFGSVPPRETRDHWLQIFGKFSVSF